MERTNPYADSKGRTPGGQGKAWQRGYEGQSPYGGWEPDSVNMGAYKEGVAAQKAPRCPSLINRAKCRRFLIDEAQTQGKVRLTKVSQETLDWLERELTKKMVGLVTDYPHGGPKTIYPPTRD